jgi:hypothetical protein
MTNDNKIKQCTGCGWLSSQPLGVNEKGEPYLACCPDNNYKDISAVEWLINQVKSAEWQDMYIWHKEAVFELARQIEIINQNK